MVYNIISGVFLAIRAAIFLFSAWALVSMLRRDAMDFSATVRGRGFWLAVLIGCTVVSLIGLLRGGVPGLLEWLVLYGLVGVLHGPRGAAHGAAAGAMGASCVALFSASRVPA